jgi:hypothetical protein
MSNIPTNNDPLQRWIQAQSTHQALGNRQAVYEKLGLNKPGFWVDLKQRTLQQNKPAEDMPTAAQQPISYGDPYDDTALNYTVDPAPKINPVKPLKMPLVPGQGQTATTGRGQLQQREKEMAWGQLRGSLQKNPIIGVDGSDFGIAEKNYMNINLVTQMNADPDKFMSQALITYYNQKQQADLTDWANNKTNFEKMSAMASNVKKQNKRTTGRFVAPNEAQKSATQQTRVGGTKGLNVKMGGYYSSPLYLSPFGN